MTVTDQTISSSLVVYQLNLESRSFAWAIQPLHIHKGIIMSPTLVTEIKQKLPCRKRGTRIAFTRDTSSKMAMCLFRPAGTHELSQFPHPNRISTQSLAMNALSRCKTLRFQQPLLSYWVTNQVPRQSGERQCVCLDMVSQNRNSSDYILVEGSCAAFEIFRG